MRFEISCGGRAGIIGRNGAGKRTHLKILSCITEPTDRVDGALILALPPRPFPQGKRLEEGRDAELLGDYEHAAPGPVVVHVLRRITGNFPPCSRADSKCVTGTLA